MFPIFLWVKKYKSLENFYITLDDAYDIDFEIEKDKTTITTLNIKRKEVPEDKKGFYGSNIDSIKAIVGKNGTGKTSILEIMSVFSEGNRVENSKRLEEVNEFLIIYKINKKNEENREIFKIEGHSRIGANEYYQFLKGIDMEPYLNNFFNFEMTIDNKYIDLSRNLEECGVMKLTSDFVPKITQEKNSNRKECEYRKNHIYKLNLNISDVGKKAIYNYLSSKKNEENYRNFSFSLKIFKRTYYLGEIKKKIKGKIEYSEIRRMLFPKVQKNCENIKDIILKEFTNNLYHYLIFTEIGDINNPKDLKNKIKSSYIYFESIYLQYETYEELEDSNLLEILLERIAPYEDTSLLKEYLLELCDSLKELESLELIKKKSKDEENNWFWDEEILEEDEENIIYEINYPIASEKNEKNFKILENFLEVYDRIVTRSWKLKLDTDEILEILSLEEQGMSDGEKMRLNQFATIFGALEGEFKDKKYVTILFDEVETSLHPEWCRTLINDYLEELRTNYPEKKFKLIFATHSPFILSDLLAEDIISLGVKNGETSIESIPLKGTFGGNIHNLLKQNMFMESTFGEFARIKIKKFVKDIEEAKSYEELKKLSQSLLLKEVGEPLVKRRLEIMIEEKMKSLVDSKEYYEMKIQEYQKKIEELKDE